MLLYVSATVSAALCTLTAWNLLGQVTSEKSPHLCALGLESDPDIREIGIKKRAALTALTFAGTLAACLKISSEVGSLISALKLYIAMACITGSACVDAREKRIPNIFPAVMAISGLILLAAGLVTGQSGALAYITSSVFATLVTVLLLMIAAALTKGGIGAGDIKLLGALAFSCGVFAIGGTAVIGVFLCAACGVFLLVTKKKSMKESLPFGPFLLLGFLCSIMLSIY